MNTEIEEIRNVAVRFPFALKAERKGKNTLILRRMGKPIRRSDKAKAIYELEYRWHNDEESWNVVGNKYSYWTKKEIDLNISLFEQINLF